MPTVTRVHLRWMIRRDMSEVVAMEQSLPKPWVEEDFLKCLRRRNCIGFVATDANDSVVGSFVYELHKRRVGIVHMAVAENLRRQGVGRQMMAKMKAKLSSHRRQALVATVPEDCLPMQMLLKSEGFRAGVLEDGSFQFVYLLDGLAT